MKKCSSEMHQFELTDPVRMYTTDLEMASSKLLLKLIIKEG